jgi:hypothetical protein
VNWFFVTFVAQDQEDDAELKKEARNTGGARGRRGACKECFKAAQRAAWVRDPKVQGRQRQILERWRDERLSP